MNETFRAIMSDVVLPVLTVALVVAAIVVVVSYVQKSGWRSAEAKRAQQYADQMQQRQPRIAGHADCTRCETQLIGYVVGESSIHWQHVTPPTFDHHPMATERRYSPEIMQDLREGTAASGTEIIEGKGRAGY